MSGLKEKTFWKGIFAMDNIDEEYNNLNGEFDMQDNPFFRYENDVWFFGIRLIDGTVLGISKIMNHKGDWMEVEMLDRSTAIELNVAGARCSRKTTLINKKNILYIFELCDT